MRSILKYLPAVVLILGICKISLAQNLSGTQTKDYKKALEEVFFANFKKPAPLYSQDTLSVIVIGDVMMHTKQLLYDYTGFLEKIRERLTAADLAVANMEFTLAGPPYSGYPAFSAPDGFADYVASCGVDIFLTANNHILDKGHPGVVRTLDYYEKMQEEGIINYTGISADSNKERDNYPLMVALKGVRIAFLNFTYGTNCDISQAWPKVNKMEKDDIMSAINRAKEKKADYIIALPHWGIEYKLKHSEDQEKMAYWLAENGVDMIIGAHPHVVQDSLIIKTKEGRKVPVFYSLGNAVSNMSAVNTRLELAVTIKIAKSEDGSTELLNPEIDFLWCTLPGRLADNFHTIAVKDYADKRELWIDGTDYDNMMETYSRVKAQTGIEDKFE